MEENESGGGDRAAAPGAEADPAQRLEGGLEQGVAAFGRRTDGRVQLVGGQPAAGVCMIGVVRRRRSPS
jgi:hypothetical protein